MTNESGLLTINEAAHFLSVSKTTLRRWTNQGILKCYRFGNRAERRFSKSDLLEFIEGKETSTSTATPTAELPGAVHVSTYYRDTTQQWEIIRPYFLENLRDGGRTVYLYNSDPDWIVRGLARAGLQPESLMESGHLVFLSTGDTYLKGGYFDQARMLDFWAEKIDQAQKDGIDTLFFSGEMGWSNSGLPGCELLSPYESELEEILRNFPSVTVVCQYPLQEFSGETIFDSVCIHPTIQWGNQPVTGLKERFANASFPAHQSKSG
jgi:excisionase family DNA binding protein